MKDYIRLEDQELYDEGYQYLLNVKKDEFLSNDDSFFYSRQIQNGTIPSCDYVKYAVEREERKKQDPNCPYYFDPLPGFKFFAFCRHFYHLIGPLGGQPFILSWWQIWVFSQLLGWKHKTGPHKGKRSYKIAYLECPRGSGKTAMMALFGLYMLTLDDEWSPEIYVAATKREQANILFGSVLKQINYGKNKKIIDYLKVAFKRDTILCNADKGGTFKSLSKEAKSFDGLNIHCALVDEIHAHPSSEIWDVLNSGAAKRDQSLMVAITTAGTNFNSFGFSYSSYIKKLLQGLHDQDPVFKDDSVFGCVWTVDSGDDLYSPLTWQKANPGWFSSVNQQTIQDNIMRTKSWPETKAETFTKHLDVWYSASDKWLQPEYVYACNDLNVPETHFKDEKCIIGVDLAYAEDMLVYVKVYEKYNEEDEKYHYYVYPEYYTPSINLTKPENTKYVDWVNRGLLTKCDGDIIDLETIQRKLEYEYEKGNVFEIAFDRWNATQMAQSLQNRFGADTVYYVDQSMGNLNDPSKLFKTLIIEKRIHFHSDIMVWNCLNCYAKMNNTGLIHVEKESTSSKDKIDGVVACINALSRWMEHGIEFSEPCVWRT